MTGPVVESSECLEWISAELSNSLRDASGALERFVDAPEQREPLADVVAELQRILGALRVVEVTGAALLAEEMVYVSAALEQGAIKDSREGLEALSRAIVQLPAYLDRILAGGRDIPLVLLPLLNDLRAVRGSPLLSENTLFLLNIDTDVARPSRPQPSGSDVVAVARKLRPRYQAGLLGWLRGESPDSNLATMGAVTANIEQAASSQALYQLYWIVAAVIEALREDGLESGVAVKRLLGQADRYMKQLIDHGEGGFDENPPSQLVNNLLYYVARATSGGERVQAVKAAFSLNEMLPEEGQLEAARDNLAAPSAQLMETVAAAIRQDLETVKDVLDIRMRTGDTGVDELAAQLGTLKRIADTLAMLGLGDLRAVVLAERERFAGWAEGATPTTDDEMLVSAAVLLSLEDGLQTELMEMISFDASARPSEDEEEAATANPDALRESDFRAVATAVLRECLVNLSRVKESISQFLASSTHALDNVPALLRAINAGLLMLGKSRAVGVVDRIADHCRHTLTGHQVSDFSEHDMDRLADAIVSIEYYLDTLRRGRSDPWYMLDNASACLDVIELAREPAAAVAQADDNTETETETGAVADSELPVLTAVVDATGETRRITPALRDPRGIDPELLETFIDEAREEIASVTRHWPAWRSRGDREQLTVVRRSFHTLKGSGRMVGAERFGEMGWAIETLLNKFLNGTIEAQPDALAVIDDAVAVLPALLEELEVGTLSETNVDAIIARARAVAAGESAPAAPAGRRGMDPVLYEIFRNETAAHLARIDSYIEDARRRGAAPPFSEDLHRAWHTLNGSASMAGAESVARIAGPIQGFVRNVLDEEREISADTVAVFDTAVAAIRGIVEKLSDDTRVAADAALLARVEALRERAAVEIAPEPEDEAEQAHDEIASIFGDEATELLDAADMALQRVDRDASDRSSFSELQRHLHTLKGGARMAGVGAIGDLSHELESLLLSKDGADRRVVELAQESIDRMHNMAEALRSGREVRVADDLIERIQALAKPAQAGQPPAEAAPPQPEAPAVESQPPATPDGAGASGLPTPDEEREVTYAFAPAERSAARELFSEEVGERRESARVSADLLDDLLNNVGEVSIYHSRLEQQVNTIGFNTAELARTVVRLREQLRKLEMETEAQILHGHQEAGARADFDPLEMDRYSMIQQLSRALAESVSDLSSIQGLLDELTRDAETLLVQQSRVTTELQDGLMRTRMVPFQRHVPRFSRLVRQTAAEADKRAELIVDGAGELDRQVLDRMLAPFEHMLRNAVIHGIEPPQDRERLGKPVTGTITISLAREGSEMVIVIRDDGAGMDLDAIRDKARALGLIEADSALTETEVLQLSLEPGFSTAPELTQSAGRGVGMDVVANVVKQLGGSLAIQSVRGRGAAFTVRLPLTLAISQALLVRAGEEVYAIPVLSLAGVARLSTNELREYLDDEDPQFEYGGALYRLEHLGHLLGTHGTDLDAVGSSVALVLARAGEHSTALIADEIVGSREVVVKPVGPQIAAVRGVAGATILGDGSIVVILDINALVRSARPARMMRQPAPEPRDERPSIMVVDDSITVRRVTQRLLERHDMRVTTAKDGVDAVSAMQEIIPDLILLDIEMPRMDGYEVATHVRNSPRLQHIPIVMVTSRVGDKHRNRAIELGVNAYLGKPYQEATLLETIKPLLRRAPVPQS